MKNWIKKPVIALVLNLLLVYALFMLTRLVFVWVNGSLYDDHMSAGYLLHLCVAGLRFDTTAILYLNCWMILCFLLPLHFKERSPRYYSVLRVLFVVVNMVGLIANLCDCAYFPFTGRRTTWNVLQEFGGESNFVTIILHESLPYWYLFPLAFLLAWLLWRCFVTPVNRTITKGKELVTYYFGQTVALALAVGLTIGGMRGGFTMAVRPITLSNANQYIEHSIDAGIVLNTPFSIMRTIGKKAFVEREYMSQEEAEQLYSPLHQPADSVTFTPRNVVVLILESFGKQAMARGYMPFVDSLAHVGRSYEYSFASGRKSIDGMPSVLSSIPSFVEPFFLTSGALNELSGIAGELTRNKGYHSAFFHGAENGSMGFQAFSTATGFQQYFGRTEYNEDPRYHGDDDFDGTWAIWDEEFLQFYCDKMSEMPEPFVTSVFTASSHPPFAMPERYKDRFPPTEPRIFASVAYSDNAVRLFFEKASRQPWFQNTIFVLTADHTSESVDPEYTHDLGRYKVPIVFYAPGIVAEDPNKTSLVNHQSGFENHSFASGLCGIDSTTIMSQADIMPTLLGLLGYDRPYVAFGQDKTRTSAEASMAVNFLPGNGYYQLIQGDWFLQYDGDNLVHAYRFKEDPLLEHDQKEQCPAELLARLQSLIQQYMYRMNHNQLVYK